MFDVGNNIKLNYIKLLEQAMFSFLCVCLLCCVCLLMDSGLSKVMPGDLHKDYAK